MAPDYPTMLRTAAQVQAALAATAVELAGRWAGAWAQGGLLLARTAAAVWQAPPEQRQGASERAAWTVYAAHHDLLRGVAGATPAALLVLLNEIDLRRGRRPAQPDPHATP